MGNCSKKNVRTWMRTTLPQSGGTGYLRFGVVLALFLLLLSPSLHAASAAAEAEEETKKVAAKDSGKRVFNGLSKVSATCTSCHVEDNRSIIQQWGLSKHYGANVGCYECHQAEKGDPDAFMHKKYLISTLVTPKDCARCHEPEAKQFAESSHAKAASNLEGSAPHFLATMVQGDQSEEGTLAATSGCVKCHGSQVKVNASGKLNGTTWPNSGIGRVNPDGSLGTCTACHQQHDFSQAQVRRPEACGRCHQGPSHAQQEIYNQSKHGITFNANADKMHLDSPKWIPGQDYFSGPTCVTCHMSPTMSVGMTHNVSKRVSWDLTQPISKQDENADDHREEMQAVCSSCHTENVIANFYEQFDGVVNLYNSKYGEPGTRLMDALLKAGLRTKQPFDDAIEWTWFKLWHQAGRKARQGAAMQAADYVQWQGFYEVAELFYGKLLPQAAELISKAEAANRGAEVKEVKALLDEIKNDPANKWMNGQ